MTARTLPSRRHRTLWHYADRLGNARSGSVRHRILACAVVRVARLMRPALAGKGAA